MAEWFAYDSAQRPIALRDEDELHRGGEGRILLVRSEPDLVAKIYHPGKPPLLTAQAAALAVLPQAFVKPLAVLFDDKGLPIGFTMARLGPEFFPLASLFNKAFCQRNAIAWSFKLALAKQLAEAVAQAHARGIQVGDLNPFNVMVDLAGQCRLIDADSYQSPARPHTGVLLEEVRDFQRGGMVDQQSDAYALAVLVFNLLTHAHPFKGSHPAVKSLSARVMDKLALLVPVPGLKPPKCYVPLPGGPLLDQMRRVLVGGERFLLVLDPRLAPPAPARPAPQAVALTDFLVKTLLVNAEILELQAQGEGLVVETQDAFLLFDARHKGQATALESLPKSLWQSAFTSGAHFFALRGGQLHRWVSPGVTLPFQNLRLSPQASLHLYGDILLALEPDDNMRWIYLSESLNDKIRNLRKTVLSKSFQTSEGLLQNTAGQSRVHFHSGKDLALAKLRPGVRRLAQQGPIGVASWIEAGQVCQAYFRVEGLEARWGRPLDDWPQFAHMPAPGSPGFLFEAQDERIAIRRAHDFEPVAELAFGPSTQQSLLAYAQAGLFLCEGGELFLLNRK